MAVYLFIIIAELVLLHMLSRYLNRETFSRLGKVAYLCADFPGTIIHELSHLAGCLLTRTRVREIRLFSPRTEGDRFVLGYVSHDRPAGPLSSFIIGTAPFWGGVAVLWFAAALLLPDAFADAGLASVFGGTTAAIGEPLSFMFDLARALVLPDWRAWIVAYLLISIPMHLAPSSEDLRNAAWGIIGVSAAVTVIAALSAKFGWAASGPLLGWLPAALGVLTGLLAFAISVASLVAMVLFVIARIGRM